MRGALIETWQPANAQELLLVDQICQAWWATERSARFQNGFFSNQLRTMKARNGASRHPHANDDEGIAVSMSDPENDSGYRTLFRYDDRAWSKYYRAIDRLRKLQADRRRVAGRAPEPEPPAEPVEEAPLTEELASFGETSLAAAAPPESNPADAEAPLAATAASPASARNQTRSSVSGDLPPVTASQARRIDSTQISFCSSVPVETRTQ
jgi:hypothetical protein